MDAVEYLRAVQRMCRMSPSCGGCPFIDKDVCPTCNKSDEIVDRAPMIVETVQKWVNENPAKTRQSEFLKMFPNAKKSGYMLDICPQVLDIGYMPPKRCENISCLSCKTAYWDEEVLE